MTRFIKRRQSYGLDQPLVSNAPLPIIAQRAPTVRDTAELGTLWLDQPANTAYLLLEVVNNQATWVNSPAAGATVLASLTVNPGNLTVTAGDLAVTAGNATIGGTLGVTGATTLGAATINGLLTLNGDIDINTASAFDVTATGGQDPAILLLTNGAATETIQITNTQGTAADAVDINALAGGIDIDSVGLLSLGSSRNNAQAIVLEASAGGIDILASGAAAGEDIDIIATGSSVNITSTENQANAIRLNASDAAGGIDADDGGGGMTFDSLGAISLDAAAASNFTVTGAGIDLTLSSAAGRVIVNGEEAAANAITFLSAAGGIDANAALQINVDSSQAAVADAIRIVASAADGGIDVDSGTGGHTIDSTGAISIDAAAASNFSVTGAGIDLTLASAAGRIIVNGEEAAANAVTLLSAAGGIDANAALQINIDSSQAAAADSVRIVASAADGGMDIDSGTGGLTIDTTGAFSIDGAAASNVTVAGAGIDLTVSSAAGRVVVDGGEAAADGVRIVSSAAAGGIDIDAGTAGMTLDSTGAISIDAATASNLTCAAGDLTLGATTGSIVVNADENAADAIQLLANAGAASLVQVTTAQTEGKVFNFTSAVSSVGFYVGTGSPDTVVTAAQGSLFIDVAAPALYQNTDGASAWTAF